MATISFKEAAIAYRTLDLGRFAFRKGQNGSKFESSFKSASSILLSHNFLLNDEPLNASAVSLNILHNPSFWVVPNVMSVRLWNFKDGGS